MSRRGFNPAQPRDPFGRWVNVGGGGNVKGVLKSAAKAGGKAAGREVIRSGGKKVGFTKLAKHQRATDNTAVTIKGVKLPIHYVPYARVNKRSQTIGHNLGTKIIPGTGGRRLVTGGYLRVESTKRTTAVDRIAGKAVAKIAPPGTKRGRAAAYAKKNFTITNPAIRGSVGNAQVRLGTSRGAGPTIIVRRGKHKVAQPKSQRGVNQYNTQVGKVAGKRAEAKVKKPRPQRRKAAAARRRKR